MNGPHLLLRVWNSPPTYGPPLKNHRSALHHGPTVLGDRLLGPNGSDRLGPPVLWVGRIPTEPRTSWRQGMHPKLTMEQVGL